MPRKYRKWEHINPRDALCRVLCAMNKIPPDTAFTIETIIDYLPNGLGHSLTRQQIGSLLKMTKKCKKVGMQPVDRGFLTKYVRN